MSTLESEKHLLQSKWLILLFFLGAVLLSNNLQWLYGAGPQAAYIIKISLGISVTIACSLIAAALEHKLFSAPLFIGSGWVGFVIGWALCILELAPYQRKTWILENLGSSIASVLAYSAIAALFLLLAYGGVRLLKRTSVSAVATWACFTLAFFVSDGPRWYVLLKS